MSFHISLSPRHARMLQARADEFHGGNVSAAVRSSLDESVDNGMRMRQALREKLNGIHRKMADLQAKQIGGGGVICDEIKDLLAGVEVTIARVSTS